VNKNKYIKMDKVNNFEEFCVNESSKNGKIDKVVVDVPLFIRMLEYAKEDAKTDMDLHKVTENILKLLEEKDCLCMEDYKTIVKTEE
jgi:hypothetical protein